MTLYEFRCWLEGFLEAFKSKELTPDAIITIQQKLELIHPEFVTFAQPLPVPHFSTPAFRNGNQLISDHGEVKFTGGLAKINGVCS